MPNSLGAVARERRRCLRQKVHTPAYARFNSTSSAVALDLSEILDLSEDGMAIQTATPLEAGHSVDLSLDLSETEAHLQATGYVVWSDPTGRAGIRFWSLPDSSLRQLREWLFLNLMAACANHIAQSSQMGLLDAAPGLREPEPAAQADYTFVLAALVAVQREVEALGANLDAALQLIAERARTFTRAEGAAIALAYGEEIVCRASAGVAAPGVGVRLHTGSGFSAECIRTGRLLRCDDSETDPRVDSETCRQLGIRSMAAVPVRVGDTAIGLLEVFSSRPHAFAENHSTILQRLAETALAALNRAARSQSQPAPDARSQAVRSSVPAWDTVLFASSFEEPSSGGGFTLPRSHLFVLIAAAAALALAMGFLLAPWIESKLHAASPQRQSRSSQPPLPKPSALKTVGEATTLEEFRSLAEQGDATAQFVMGRHFATGEDVKQDYAEAVRWFTKAAEQGHVGAEAILGAYYWAGRGVTPDLNKAYFWAVLARANGDEDSKVRVAMLSSRMTRSQILAVQQQAEEWLKQHATASNPTPTQ